MCLVEFFEVYKRDKIYKKINARVGRGKPLPYCYVISIFGLKKRLGGTEGEAKNKELTRSDRLQQRFVLLLELLVTRDFTSFGPFWCFFWTQKSTSNKGLVCDHNSMFKSGRKTEVILFRQIILPTCIILHSCFILDVRLLLTAGGLGLLRRLSFVRIIGRGHFSLLRAPHRHFSVTLKRNNSHFKSLIVLNDKSSLCILMSGGHTCIKTCARMLFSCSSAHVMYLCV